jgi:DNA modification methylase
LQLDENIAEPPPTIQGNISHMPENTLYYGDNLEVMRKYLPDASVDLVYLDPPFNSNRDYNLLFREQSGEPAQGQIKAFTDTWQWSERAYDDVLPDLRCARAGGVGAGVCAHAGAE